MNNIHPTAIIEAPFQIGKNVFIGAYVVIREGAFIGDDVVIGHHTVIERDVTIGAESRIQAGCFISPGTVIHTKVFVGPHVSFLNDQRILSHGRPNGGSECWKPAEVHYGARIGGNSTIGPGVIIGENSMVGACSYIRKNVPSRECWWGCPAQKQGTVPKEEFI